MTSLKKLMLGTVAGLMAAGAAQAADLPGKAKAAQYVKICSAYGEGFYYIPGTDTCLRVGGWVRSEWYQTSGTNSTPLKLAGGDAYRRNTLNLTNTLAVAALILDARSNTSMGTLRSFAELRPNIASGGTAQPFIHRAFIQLGGLSVGYMQSFFDFYANANVLGTNPSTIGSDQRTNVIAYTADLGNGVTATLAAEDGTRRRTTITDLSNTSVATATGYAGHAMPDVVGNVRIDATWGSAQLSGAVHQLRAAWGVAANPAAAVFPDTSYGYGVQGGVTVNLPMLGKGDAFTVQAAYADGALGYLGLNVVNSVITNRLGDTKNGAGYAIMADFLHYWTPSLKSAVFGGVAAVNYNAIIDRANFGVNGGVRDVTVANVGANLVWTPVNNFDIGAQFDVTEVNPRGGGNSDTSYRTLLMFERRF